MRIDARKAACLFVLLVVYEVVAYLNSFVYDLKGAGVDAEQFQAMAEAWALQPTYAFNISVGFYVQIIGTIYWLFGPHEFVATQISIAAILLAAAYLWDYCKRKAVRARVLVILVIFLWPAMVPRCGTTLREPLIILFAVGLAVTLAEYVRTSDVRYLRRSVLPAVGLLMIHKVGGVMVVGAYSLLMIYGRSITKDAANGLLKLGTVVLLLLGGAYLVAGYGDLREMRVLSAAATMDADEMQAMLDSKYGVEARAAYDAPVSFSGPIVFVASSLKSMAYYFIQPLPGRISTLLDVYAFLEVWARLSIVLYVVYNWRRLNKDERYLVAVYFAISYLWSLGTTNYGTASRHHLTHTWIVIVVAAIVHTRRRTNNKLIPGHISASKRYD